MIDWKLVHHELTKRKPKKNIKRPLVSNLPYSQGNYL